ncbi:hypothetical protein HRF80_05845 [Enterococcus faecalis]|nr:hypothetical protein [Enterococcus faecalis]EJI7155740.1 hypothetical protein [Enterococcus faecalis]ELU9006479.1 hypothetical protein [Enterococcus faecalis]NSR45251.1 hypothetical protein [Enterococcus faecalis]
MTKIFEDEFMEWQADMVDIVDEYTEGRAENIYLYGSIEDGGYFFNLFFKIKGKILFMHQVNSVLSEKDLKFDTSDYNQGKVLEVGVDDLQKVADICKKYSKDIPTELKLFYDVKNNSLDAKYKYNPMYSDTYEIGPDDLFISWYEQAKSAVENPQTFGFE